MLSCHKECWTYIQYRRRLLAGPIHIGEATDVSIPADTLGTRRGMKRKNLHLKIWIYLGFTSSVVFALVA
jgi:hypothetical protein